MTIKDVAEYCGVSVSTVSRVLNDHPDVSDSVRSMVNEAIERLHYVPNRTARDLVSVPSATLGVVVRGRGNAFFAPIIDAISREAAEEGYSLVPQMITSNEDEVSAAAEFVRAKRLRGVVLLGGHFDYTRAEVAGINVPFVCCSFDNQFGDLDSADYSSVSIDDTAEAFKATSTLIGAGHTHVAMLLDSSSSNSIGELRYKGYCAALLDAGIQLDDDLVVEVGDFSMAATYEATAKLLARRPDVTAIFAISDLMGVAAMKAASDAGLRTPDDISVIAIDGIETTLYTIPTLTTLCQPQETLGKQAVKILVDVLDKRLPSKHVRLETTLREGGSVARAR
ncbi:LacI family DNA-binding transcriptional regulator [Olsenella uli]|uniref:LacI family DNA-binding transcriptional regulator n=1 Tax=Olsenella uli TaxID=133926 RepID=UPI0024A80FE0|nr:LacI family DNA-binding transcriptional regulator [Olsenella uli]